MDLVTQLCIHDLQQPLRGHHNGLLIEMDVFVVVIMEDDEIIDQCAEDIHDLFLTEGKGVCPALVVYIFESGF